MIREVPKNSNNKAIILQTNHNYYIRSVLVSIVKMVLCPVITSAIGGFIILLGQAAITTKNPKDLMTAIVLVCVIVLSVNVAYFLSNIIGIINMHNQISKIEDSALGNEEDVAEKSNLEKKDE